MDIEHPEVWPREVLWTCWIIAFELFVKCSPVVHEGQSGASMCFVLCLKVLDAMGLFQLRFSTRKRRIGGDSLLRAINALLEVAVETRRPFLWQLPWLSKPSCWYHHEGPAWMGEDLG